MSGRAARAAADVGAELAVAGMTALVLSEAHSQPHVELLLPRGPRAHAARPALARAGWRWQIATDGPARVAPRRRLSFDGGSLVTVHEALPAGPLPALALRGLERALWSGARADSRPGLLAPLPEPRLAYLGVQAARGMVRYAGQLEELRDVAGEVTDWEAVWCLARAAGAERALRSALGMEPAALQPSAHALAWRAARRLRGMRRARPLPDVVLGEPWTWATTRCRFDGLLVVAGPGTFLPRGVSERLVQVADERLAGRPSPRIVDVGTGCGAVALALARRHPDARVLGIELDAGALRWARRNARRLGCEHVDFAAGSLLDPLPASWRHSIDVVVANVPCLVPGTWEGGLDAPPEAYVGSGGDGLGLQRQLAAQSREALRPGGWLAVQLAPAQWAPFRAALQELGYEALAADGSYDDIAVFATGRRPGTPATAA